jgi:hypothetical protein
MDYEHRHRKPVQRRARRERDELAPGKHTLTEHLDPRFDSAIAQPGLRASASALVGNDTAHGHGLVQFDPSARPDLEDPDRIHALAEAGTRGAGGALPHLAAIQRAFGHHDVGGVIAHVGGAATEAAGGMNALAYASGDHVAFAHDPDVHLAAHEAAHVVQQRGGVRLSSGVGQSGDAFEQHADEVADRVVRGESAEALLDHYAHRGPAGGAAVQHRPDPRDETANPVGRGELGQTGSGGGERTADQSASREGEPARDETGPGSANGSIRVQTAASAPQGGRERTTVGVGERVTFTAPGNRSGSWTASGGTTRSGSGARFQWTAPATPGSFTITLAGGRQARAARTAERDAGAQGQAPASANQDRAPATQDGAQDSDASRTSGSRTAESASESVTVNVIAPSSVSFTRLGELPYSGAGAGMELAVRIGPGTASFGAVRIKEISEGSAGTAVGVSGYFAERFSPENLRHDATREFAQVQATNQLAEGHGDTAGTDPAEPLPEPWTNGTYSWVIPYHYQVQGDGDGRPFTTVVQTFRIEGPSGRVTVTKGNASISRDAPPGIMEPARQPQQPRSSEEPVRQPEFGELPAPAR